MEYQPTDIIDLNHKIFVSSLERVSADIGNFAIFMYNYDILARERDECTDLNSLNDETTRICLQNS